MISTIFGLGESLAAGAVQRSLLAVTGEGIALVTAVTAATAAAISAGIAAWQGLLMKRSERNRTQPIVVAYEQGEATREKGQLIFHLYLVNEGVGPALDVRFGVLLEKVEYRYIPRPAGAHGTGDVPRALGPGRRFPPGGGLYELVVPDTTRSGESLALERHVCWCRYRNAFGQRWETRNSWQPDVELEIERLRAPASIAKA
jgi:hypothetical protein